MALLERTLGLGVHGLERGCLHLFGSAHQRVDHLTPQHPAGDDALKIVFLPDLQFLGGIGVLNQVISSPDTSSPAVTRSIRRPPGRMRPRAWQTPLP